MKRLLSIIKGGQEGMAVITAVVSAVILIFGMVIFYAIWDGVNSSTWDTAVVAMIPLIALVVAGFVILKVLQGLRGGAD